MTRWPFFISATPRCYTTLRDVTPRVKSRDVVSQCVILALT